MNATVEQQQNCNCKIVQ